MADDTHLDDDALNERPDTIDADDPFAALMDLSPDPVVAEEPVAASTEESPEDLAAEFEQEFEAGYHSEPVIAEEPVAAPVDQPPEDLAAEFEQEFEAGYQSEAEFVEELPDAALEAPSVAPAMVDAPAPFAPEDLLENFLDAEFATPEPEVEPVAEDELLNALDADLSTPVMVETPVVQEQPATESLEEEFSLEDMGLEESDAAPAALEPTPEPALVPAIEPVAEEPFDLDDLDLDDIDLSEPSQAEVPVAAPVAAAPIVEEPELDNEALDMDLDLDDLDLSEELDVTDASTQDDMSAATFDIDDFFDEEEADTEEDTAVVEETVAIESEQVIEEAAPDPLSPAIAAATSLSASDEGWLAAEPINQEAEIGHTEEPTVELMDEEDPLQDLDIDLDLDLDDVEADDTLLTDAEITNAMRDAEVDSQIQSLDAHYATPQPEPVAEMPVSEPIAEDNGAQSALGGAVAAGAVGLGLSKVFGGTTSAAPEAEAQPAEQPLELNDLDSVLGEIDNVDAPKAEAAREYSPEIDIADFTLETDETQPEAMPEVTAEPVAPALSVPTVNVVEPNAEVPVTGTISVPHVDYDVAVEPTAAGPDEFEQAISDSFAEMQDADLLAETNLRPSIDDELDLALGDIELDMDTAVSSEDAYRDVIAEEMVAQPATSDLEFDSLIGEGLNFNDDELDGLRREAGHNTDNASTALPLSEMTGIAAANEGAKKQNNRKGMLIAACLLGGVVIAGAVGFGSSLFGGNADDQSAAIIRSDTDNVKEIPSEPSGVEVANKDSEVFQGSATTTTVTDDQSALVDNSEPLVGENSNKDLDRINPEDTILSDASKAVEDAAQSVMTPRRVQTLVVRPDGTIAPASEAPKIETPAIETPIADNDAERLLPSSDNSTGSDIAAVPQRTVNTVTVRNNETPRIAPQPTTPSVNSQITPDVVPIVPSRPANQPVNIVNNDTQIAAVRPTAPAAPAVAAPAVPAGTYFVQIASSPSESDARATGNRLTSRFSSVFGGRGFVIRRAVIENKGTFYRVRVPGGSKNEAAALCSRYKSAGGSCFIAR